MAKKTSIAEKANMAEAQSHHGWRTTKTKQSHHGWRVKRNKALGWPFCSSIHCCKCLIGTSHSSTSESSISLLASLLNFPLLSYFLLEVKSWQPGSKNRITACSCMGPGTPVDLLHSLSLVGKEAVLVFHIHRSQQHFQLSFFCCQHVLLQIVHSSSLSRPSSTHHCSGCHSSRTFHKPIWQWQGQWV